MKDDVGLLLGKRRLGSRRSRSGRYKALSAGAEGVAVLRLLSRVRLFATPWPAARQASPVLHRLPELARGGDDQKGWSLGRSAREP